MIKMKNKSFGQTVSATLPTSPSPEQPTTQAPSKKRFGKKLYITLAAIIAIAIILAAVLLVPPSNAEVISLGVHYSVGEKLTYDVTTSTSMLTEGGNSSTNLSSQSTLTVEVLSFNGDTYTLNYTTASALGGYSMTTSHLLEVKETDMVNLLTLLPIALQAYATNINSTNPTETAIFNQTTAKVGDTWQIPLTAPGASSAPTPEITVTFAAIQDLSVKAGTYKVFRIDFSQTATQESQSTPLGLNFVVSGQSYLEFGTCKQIQSTLQLNMTSQLSSNINYNTVISYTSTLTKDLNP
jgi:hypothetical protein